MAKHLGKCPRCGHRVDYDSAVGDTVVCAHCRASLSVPGKAKPSEGTDPLIGQTFGEFEIVELLGRGGMGAVYKARQPSLDRPVAVKVMARDLAADAEFVERFAREARVAAAVTHPNIIEIYLVGEAHGHHYIAMEFVAGESLFDLLEREGRLPAGRAVEVMKQTCAALACAHAAGVLHRDIKPANILVRSDGLVKVADFGLMYSSETDWSSSFFAKGPLSC